MNTPEPARLIPVSGIKGQQEAEERATSALLAVLTAVRPFSASLLAHVGATTAASARVEAFTEARFEVGDRVVQPDGLIRVHVGKRAAFQALVEVKTGTAKLNAEQINSYLDAARSEGFDCVITVSNEIAPSPGVHPTAGLRVRSNSKVSAHHLSWMLIVSEALKEHAHRGVEDPEQAWILSELIRYLSHRSSGVLDFADMGENWLAVRAAVLAGTLNKTDPAVVEVCQRWDQLLRVAALKLGTETGADALEVIPKAQRSNPKLRNQEFRRTLADDGTLSGVLRVPSAVSDMTVTADLRASLVNLSAAVAAPDDRTPRGAVVWLVNQLKHAPGDLVVETYPKGARSPTTATLQTLNDDPRSALDAAKRQPARFGLRLQTPMGLTRRPSRKGGFIDSVLDAVVGFYASVLQDIKPFTPRAPRIDPSHTGNDRSTPAAPEQAQTPPQQAPPATS